MAKVNRLAQLKGINFRHPDDESWPRVHAEYFSAVKKLGKTSFDEWAQRTIAEPAKHSSSSTERKVKWLANLAHHHEQAGSNESELRYALEDDVLFGIQWDSACPNCRALLFRSEIPVVNTRSSKSAQDLQELAQHRESCHCPEGSRPEYKYGMNPSPIFAGRAEPTVNYEQLLGNIRGGETEKTPKGAKLRPDRVFGLKPTDHLIDLLVKYYDSTTATAASIASQLQMPSSLAFPFFVVEAEADSSQNGHKDIQTQSAFLIRKFLNEQRDLNLKAKDEVESSLVWSLGYRGTDWKLYGCYIDKINDKVKYNFQPLWNGNLSTRDGALQLLRIIDYIVDWARDVYRVGIMARLTAAATGMRWDEISIADEPDVFPVPTAAGQPDKSSEIPATTTTTYTRSSMKAHSYLSAVSEEQDDYNQDGNRGDNDESTSHDRPLIMLPDMTRCVFRPVSKVKYEFSCLSLAEENIESLLILSGKPNEMLKRSKEAAKELVSFFMTCKELIVTSLHTVDEIELMWTGRKRVSTSAFGPVSDVEVYMALEYRCYVDIAWTLTRKLTCLAVTKPAFRILREVASGNKAQMEGLDNLIRGCPSIVIYNAIDCLLSDSALQVFRSAMSNTAIAISTDAKQGLQKTPGGLSPTPPINALSLVALNGPGIGPTVENNRRHANHKLSAMRMEPITTSDPRKKLRETRRQKKKQDLRESKYRSSTGDRSFARYSMKSSDKARTPHHPSKCVRCERNNNSTFGAHWQPLYTEPSTKHSILVLGVRQDVTGQIQQKTPDICIFLVNDGPRQCDGVETMADVIKGHLKQGHSYHTVLQTDDVHHSDIPPRYVSKTILYNLPYQYRPYTEPERWALEEVAKQLGGVEPASEYDDSRLSLWDHTQMLLEHLQRGLTWEKASEKIKEYQEKFLGGTRRSSQYGERLERPTLLLERRRSPY
ncbi:hypothetical protein GGR57DRAFT_456345 [Xylariaceae sp. FL1272]|nr:hypothetical protein GGR57DRAFT_456345 [Xylariaceae sp. FL1272]